MFVFNVVTHQQCQQREKIKVVIQLIYVNLAYLSKFLQANHRIYKEIRRFMQLYAVPFLEHKRDGNQDVSDMCEEEDLDEARFKHKKKISMARTQNQDNIITISQTEQSKGEFQFINEELYDTIELLPYIQITQQNWNQQKQLNFLTNIQQKMSQLYKKLVYFDKKKAHNLQQLAEIKQKQTSAKTYMLVGLYTGMTIVSIAAVCLLFVFNLVQPIKNKDIIDSIYFIIPMFRGIGLFIFYLWGMAFNVFIFNKFRVSYRRILQYGHHYSTAFIIMKRAAFYTFIYIFMLVLYLVGASYNTDLPDQRRFPVQYTPFVVWILFLGYIFFPNRSMFNPQGRKYFYKVLVSVIKSPCSLVNFLISWVTDQAVSFVIPFKDFGYTICFFSQNFNNPEQVKHNCLDKTTFVGFFIAYFITIIPLLFRMIQCYRQAKLDTGIFIGHIQMWNFVKYCMAMITSTLSFLFALQKENKDQLSYSYIILQLLFIFSSICSTFYAYYWDLKYDWGFLQKSSRHKFLRNHLNYQNNKIYYLAIIFNLLFRFGWTISLSLVLHNTDFKQVDIVLMGLGMVQITRRCIWNFFRIQKEHIIYCKNYAATPDILKQIQVIKAINQGNIENIAANLPVNLEYQPIPYFFNSQQYINKIQILPQQFITNFDSNKITIYRQQFQKLINEEQKQRKQYNSP